jgi:hypothetical protein
MYLRLVMFTLGPGMRSRAEGLAAQFGPILKAQQGFRSVTFFADDSVGEYGALIEWDSRDDAEAARTALEPHLLQALVGVAKGSPLLRRFEVYDPTEQVGPSG